MHISYKGDYALKAMLELAIHYSHGVVTIAELSKRLDIPIKFLEQVLLDLKHSGFLESRRGTQGGYRLAKHPAKITLGEIITLVEGPIEPIACARQDAAYKGCKDIYKCVFRNIWLRIAKANSEIIDTVTFEDLARSFLGYSEDVILNYSI
ncbi:MAG: Rrf2 family transcriptional regulator [Candidatus Omnitrophota bacterium]